MALPGEIDLRRAAERWGVGPVGLCARADDAIRMSGLLRVRVRVRVWVCRRQTGGLGRNAKRAKQRVGRDGVRVGFVVTAGGGGRRAVGSQEQVVDNIHTVQGDVSETGERSVGGWVEVM